jgi:polar amino acid transport system substrate-binding protein
MYRLIISALLIISTLNADIVIAFSSKDGKIAENQKIEFQKLKEIASKNNITIRFKATPWKRALLLIEKGRIDGVINASYKKDRAIYAKYPMKKNKLDRTKRLNDGMSYYIYKNRNSTLKWDGQKFINPDGAIGVMKKFAVIDDLKKHPNITIKEFENNPEIIRNLATAKIAAYAGTYIAVDKVLKKYPSLAKNIVRESMPIRKKDYFLIFSKKTYQDKEQEMEIIWNGLKKYNK